MNKMKKQPMEQEKIFAHHVSDKGLASRVYKELNSTAEDQHSENMD